MPPFVKMEQGFSGYFMYGTLFRVVVKTGYMELGDPLLPLKLWADLRPAQSTGFGCIMQ